MEIVNVHKAKSTLSQLLVRVEAGEEVVMRAATSRLLASCPSGPTTTNVGLGRCAA